MVSSIERFHCIQGTDNWVPVVSSIERFHCIGQKVATTSHGDRAHHIRIPRRQKQLQNWYPKPIRFDSCNITIQILK